MSSIFEKWNQEVDQEKLKKEVEEAAAGSTDFEDVPVGEYEVSIEKMELVATKTTGKPMLTVWFNILTGEYKGQKIFMNQVITQGFQIHIANEFLRSLDTGVDVDFDGNYEHYNNTILDVMEVVDKQLEFLLDYGENKKGYNTFKIKEVFEV